MKLLWGALFLSVPLVACSGECTLTDLSSCNPGLVCAPRADTRSNDCFPPVEVRGQVVDATTNGGIGGAVIQAQDRSGLPAAELSTSGKDGAFTLRLMLVRKDGSGTPEQTTVQLQVGAQGYSGYPGRLRVPVDIDTSTVTQARSGEPYVIQGDASNIVLQPLPSGQDNYPFIAGTLAFGQGQSAPLLVAEANGQGYASTLADSFGQYVLFNVPPGTYNLGVYSQNATYASVTGINVSVGSPANSVVVGQTGATLANISGNVTFATGSGPTSVVLIPRTTFDTALGRGVPVPGLRSPAPGTGPNVTGAWSINGIPDGDYFVVPAYENDGLVRKPGSGFNGLGVQDVVVNNGVPSPAVVPDLAVVPAVQLTGPGATTLESVGTSPALAWTAYPSAASYQVTVFDESGASVFQTTSTGTSVTVSPALAPGLYQWRVVALDGSGAPLSMSEDQVGVFRAQ